MNNPIHLKFSRREIAVVFVIIALAFAYRVVIIWDRAVAPQNAGYFDPLPNGSDQLKYYSTIFGFRTGTYPPPTFHYQPGISYFLIGLTSLIGSTNLLIIRLSLAAFSAINCGLLYAVARLAFDSRRIGIIAATLLAFYPVSAFYDTDLVITSQAIILLTIALFGALWMYRMPRYWIGAILLGFVIGFGAITRLEIAVSAFALTAWLFVVRLTGKSSLLPFVLTLLVTVGFIAPVVLHNRQGEADFLITPVGMTEIYRGFNRDANGIYFVSRADFTTRFDYFHYLALDVQLGPLRFIELVLRKTGLFFSATEAGNNLNYIISGKNVSPVLRFNPLDFRVLIVLTGFGIVALWREKRAILLPFLVVCGGMFVMTMLIWIEARIRAPIIVAMIPLAAYGVDNLWQGIRRPTFWRQNLLLVAVMVITLTLSWVAENNLPRKVTTGSLPQNAQRVNALYNDELRLVGYRIEDQYTDRGHFEPFRPYVVTLYWMVERPTSIDYSYALKFVIESQAIDQFDHPLGYVNYPQIGTSDWKVGTIYVEHVGMAVRTFDVTTEISGHLWLEVYPERNAEQLFEPVGVGASPLELAHPAVMWGSGLFPTLNPALINIQPDVNFGDLLVLEGWLLPSEGHPGEIATITLGWQTTSNQIRDSYIIGVYFQNANGDYIANNDSPPRSGQLLTNSLPPLYQFEDERNVVLPETPGTYQIYVGVYRQYDGIRLAVNNSTETLVPIGVIQVK